KEFHYEGGIKSYVAHLNRSKHPIPEEPVYVAGSKDEIQVEVSLQYKEGYTKNIYSITKNIHKYEGGTHDVGFNHALT
ncbi:DNA topoisomerase IV subunit B, partial [Bacillus cereus group sp. N21]|nr:DNA topoisomerase IV subunit B [Bacillus cereus group sp. N21]